MKKIILGVAIVIVALVVVLRLARLRGHPWPETAHKSFSDWGQTWVLPPRPDGAHAIYLAYFKGDEGGRIETEEDQLRSQSTKTPLKLTVVDETADKDVPLLRDWLYGEVSGSDDWKLIQVANVWLEEGHRYRLKIDPEQLAELAKFRHQLWVDLDVSEKRNWSERNDPNWREKRQVRQAEKAKKKKEWEPEQLKKARAARQKWETEKARMRGESQPK
ncbi:MAG TPA: hypothetical protein VJ783_19100 [Pirellulales bacterium]|nr:hypothetical protein [Pirellulales bacterium]